jgi:1,4-dihydroxy-2-naphthoyl-CoA hydrolase
MDWSPSLCTSGGLLHGGALMSLADSTGAACAFFNLPEGAGTTTVESKTNFLRGFRAASVAAASRPLHVGRKVIVVETDLHDDQQRLVARVTQTQMVLGA